MAKIGFFIGIAMSFALPIHAHPQTSQRVGIIGGGLAGLTAAYRLQQQGISIEVFEARGHAGGRVLTYYSGASHEELGGKFLTDGGDAVHIKALLNELDLNVESYDVPYTKLYYYQNGKARDYYQLFETAPSPTEENYKALVAKGKTSNNILEVLEWFFSDHPELLRLYKLFLTNYEGSPPEQLGPYCLEQFWEFYQLAYTAAIKNDGGATTYFTSELVEGGASRLIEALCLKLKGSLHYNTPAKKIYRHSQHQVAVEFEGHPVEVFDKIILAIPCTTLRDIDIEVDIIAEDQMEAIRTLQYGTVAKVLLPVDAKGEKINFSYGTDFVCWFNRDRTLLTVYFGGEAGLLDLKNSQIFESKMREFIDILHVLYPSLEITGDPISMSWPLEEYSKGSYSNYGVGQFEPFTQRTEAYGEEVKKVFRPVEGTIFFAGEHTALKYHGTMEGAVESGDRVARMLKRSFL